MKCPGVNRGNYRRIIDACASLADVCKMSRAELIKLMGEGNATKLHDFLHTRAR